MADISTKNIGALVKEGFKTFGTGAGNQIGIFYAGNLWESVHASTGEPLDTSAVYAREVPWTGNPYDPNDMEEARQVRWALAEAIDREAINEAVLGGLGWPEYVEYCQARSPYFDDKWKVSYDPQGAVARLRKTTWPDGFEIALYAQMPHAIRPEVADAVGAQWKQLGSGMDIAVLKFAYSIFRPGLVGRDTTIPWVSECVEGRTQWPFDWPKGVCMTSLTRGGFGCGLESPAIAMWYLQAAREPDKNKRIEINKQVCDYLHYWQLGTGIVAQPVLFTYNPRRIKEWTSDIDLSGEPFFGIYRVVPTGK